MILLFFSMLFWLVCMNFRVLILVVWVVRGWFVVVMLVVVVGVLFGIVVVVGWVMLVGLMGLGVLGG